MEASTFRLPLRKPLYPLAEVPGSKSCLSNLRIEYNKKKDKKTAIKFQKDETIPRNDMYKSHVVHVPSGEPPNSVSRPVPRKKPGVVKPITQGKLLRAGGPSVSIHWIPSVLMDHD